MNPQPSNIHGTSSVVSLARAARDALRRRRNDAQRRVLAARLQRSLHESTRRVTGDAPVTVSMTTHGSRIQRVHLALESIASGEMRPARIILWVNDETWVRRPPAQLARLVTRGLEIRLAENYGPHTKYFPYVRSRPRHEVPLVTADDDVMYPPGWLRGLWAGYTAMPDVVSCYRANVVAVDRNGIAPYRRWARCRSSDPSLAHFATGVSGVIYPGPFLDLLCAQGDGFRATAPRADDVWLHWVALRSRTPVRQVAKAPRHFLTVPGSQATSLMSENVHLDGNDPQIHALYTPADVEILRASGAADLDVPGT